MYTRPLFIILFCAAFSCQQKTGKHEAKYMEAKRSLHDKYYSRRLELTFPNSGLIIPSETYMVASPAKDKIAGMPHVCSTVITSHHTGEDTLIVPKGSQCNFSLNQTQFFLNAESTLVIGSPPGTGAPIVLTGEAFVHTGPAEGCVISVGNQEVRLQPDTRLHISAYDNEPVICICLGSGGARVQQECGTQGLFKTGDALVIDKVTGTMQHVKENFTDAAGWTLGKLHGENETFRHIYRQLSRLFDVAIQYDDTARVHGLFVIPYREFTLAAILEALSRAQHSHIMADRDSIFITAGQAF